MVLDMCKKSKSNIRTRKRMRDSIYSTITVLLGKTVDTKHSVRLLSSHSESVASGWQTVRNNTNSEASVSQ